MVLGESITEEFKDIVRKKYYSKIDHIYNILPFERVDVSIQNKKNSIVFAGRLVDYKGVFASVKALTPLLFKTIFRLGLLYFGRREEYEDIKIFGRT